MFPTRTISQKRKRTLGLCPGSPPWLTAICRRGILFGLVRYVEVEPSPSKIPAAHARSCSERASIAIYIGHGLTRRGGRDSNPRYRKIPVRGISNPLHSTGLCDLPRGVVGVSLCGRARADDHLIRARTTVRPSQAKVRWGRRGRPLQRYPPPARRRRRRG